eukprot:6197657-Pleurochrysis_carterae.AAC.3
MHGALVPIIVIREARGLHAMSTRICSRLLVSMQHQNAYRTIALGQASQQSHFTQAPGLDVPYNASIEAGLQKPETPAVASSAAQQAPQSGKPAASRLTSSSALHEEVICYASHLYSLVRPSLRSRSSTH